MRLLLFISLVLFAFSVNGTSFGHPVNCLFMRTDTIPPPPPEGPVTLTGPSSACTGETSEYVTEVPVACVCQWYLNDILQPETSPVFTITWSQAGNHEVSVAFLCSNGELSDPESISVSVFGIPQPTPIEGDELVCAYTFHTYSTTVGPGDSCQWTVNGIIQPGYGSSIDYSFGDAGMYTFSVFAFNPCGDSSPQTLEVTAQGQAPEVFLGNDTVLLQNQTLVLDAGNPGSSYLWSTGATTQTILVSVSGFYSVTVSNDCGSDFDAIEVTILVTTEEIGEPGIIPVIKVDSRQLIISNLPAGTKAIQVFGLTGSLISNTGTSQLISLPGQGIYFVRIVADEFIFHHKIFVK